MNNPEAVKLKQRSRSFALDVIRLVRRFPRTLDAYVVGKQLVRSSTGTAANHRAACRGRSPEEFAAKVGVAAEEADESQFWLDLTGASKIMNDAEVKRLLGEAGELTAIFTASRDATKRNVALRKASTSTLILAIWAVLAILAIT
jgi:four helix bundle protein